MKNIREKAKSALAGAFALALAGIIGYGGGGAAAAANREYVSTQSPGEVSEWNLSSTKWNHRRNCWVNERRFVSDPNLLASEAEPPVLD